MQPLAEPKPSEPKPSRLDTALMELNTNIQLVDEASRMLVDALRPVSAGDEPPPEDRPEILKDDAVVLIRLQENNNQLKDIADRINHARSRIVV